MDVNQQKYKKTITSFREPLVNLIYEYPIKQTNLTQVRNLKYLLRKQIISNQLPYHDELYPQILQQIKHQLQSQNIQDKMLALRLSRALPFTYRIKLIEQSENEITKLATSPSNNSGISNSPLINSSSANSTANSGTVGLASNNIQLKVSNIEFSYQILSDIIDLLLSVYELTHQSQDIYFDVNQRILSIFSRIIQFGYSSSDRDMLRNTFQVIRAIFIMFGHTHLNAYQKTSKNNPVIIRNKLINKICNYFSTTASLNFHLKDSANLGNSSNLSMSQFIPQKTVSNKFYHLILKCRQFEARIRIRYLFGLSYLYSHSQSCSQISDLLIKQILIVVNNANQCDVNLQCFSAIKVLLSSDLTYYTRTHLLKNWCSIMSQISYKKQYLQHFIQILRQTSVPTRSSQIHYNSPLKVQYFVGVNFLQITKCISHQFSRFIIYKHACRNIMQVNRALTQKRSTLKGKNHLQESILLNIFQYGWFIDRINQQNDLFRSQFLIFLLHSYFQAQSVPSKSQVLDLLGLCHRLLDWGCTNKQQTHIPTIKFAFDMYLAFLKHANQILGNQIQKIVQQLIQKCNGQNIYFLFKLKLMTALLQLEWYRQNHQYLQKVKLDLKFLDGQIRPFMMPKNPKIIFDFEYSQSVDGFIQSRKQIQSIKIIMNLLNNVQKVHQSMMGEVQTIIVDYHSYLNDLQASPNSNRDLINCLQTVEADQFLNQSHRNFLLSLIDQVDSRGNNSQLNLQNNILYSPYESLQSEDQINIFGPMTPIQLAIKLHPHSSYNSIYLQIRKNNWVTVPNLKIIVSSGIQKKEMAFQSSILQIKIDRIGWLHFQVWTAQGNQLLIGSGNFKVRRKLKWKKINHLAFIQGIKRKSYFKAKTNLKQAEQKNKQQAQCYISYFYGEPIIVQILRSCNEVVFGVSSKQIWLQLQTNLQDIVQEFTDGSAFIF